MEQFLRRLLQKVGAQADSWVSKDGSGLTPESLIPALYHAIERNITKDQHGVRRVAPGQINVALSYEVHSQIETGMLDAIRQELAETVQSYVQDHRYVLESGLAVELICDPFLRQPFEVRVGPKPPPSTPRHWLQSPDGRMIPLNLGGSNQPRRLTLGRTGSNDIVVDDPSISRFHAAFTLNQNGEVIVSDLGSANGTFINGCEVKATALVKLGDELTLGQVPFKLVEE